MCIPKVVNKAKQASKTKNHKHSHYFSVWSIIDVSFFVTLEGSYFYDLNISLWNVEIVKCYMSRPFSKIIYKKK